MTCEIKCKKCFEIMFDKLDLEQHSEHCGDEEE